jgi:rhodanese-related sulfurtransferase
MKAKTMGGREIGLQQATLGSLKMRLKGPVLVPGDTGYDESRTVWNAMSDRVPALDLSAALDKYLSALPVGFCGIAPAALNEQIAAAKPFILDVREAPEVTSAGAIAGSVNIPLREVIKNLAKLPAKDQPIVAVCSMGHRGALVMMALQMMGYTNVKSLVGGFTAWNAANLPVVK